MQNNTATPNLIARVLLWAGPVATIIGFVAYRMWEQVVLPVDAIALLLATGVGLLGWQLHRMLRWQLASSIGAIWLALLAVFAGPLPMLATVLLGLAAIGLGSPLLPVSIDAPWTRALLATLAGLALIAGMLGWVLPLSIHRIWIYLPALLAIAIWRQASIRALLVPLRGGWRDAVAESPRLAACALLALGLASTACWLPTLQFDDLVYHLGLPSQLQQLGYYRMDVASDVWALAPWAGDILHAVVQIVAGGEARGALNALWLMLTAALLWELAGGLQMAAWARWLVVALYASQPMAAMLAGGMQTEGAATAVMLALTLLVQRAPAQPDARILRIAAVFSGLLLGLKIVHAVAIPPLLAWLLWRWRGRLPWRALPGAVALALLIGGSSYAYAALLTGNPVLPLFNDWFHSPAFASNTFTDARWLSGMHWDLLWQMTFATPRYGEYYAGASGFGLIALAGALMLASGIRKRARWLWSVSR